MSTVSEVSAKRVRRGSPRQQRFWLALDRRVIGWALGVSLLIGGLVFGAGIGVGRALAPLVPDEAVPEAELLDPGPVVATPTPVAAAPGQVAAPAAASGVPPAGRPSGAPSQGVALVAPAPVAPAAVAPAPGPATLPIVRTAPTGGYGLQLGAFEVEAEAEAFVNRHRRALQPFVIHVLASEIPKKGVWYRVRVGEYPDKAAALKAQRRLGAGLEKSAIVVSYR